MLHESAFDEYIGCASNSSEASLLQLSEAQCFVYQFSITYICIFGSIGALLHVYIVFCYFFRQYESRQPIETLIICLSFYDLFSCLGLVVAFMLSRMKRFSLYLSCPFYFMFVSYYRNSIFFIVLMLAANRYYSICNARRYGIVFSNCRIKIYTFAIFLFGIVEAVVNQLNYCFVDMASFFFVENQTYQVFSFVFYVCIYLPTLVLIVYMYNCIRVKLRTQIKTEERMMQATTGQFFEDHDGSAE